MLVVYVLNVYAITIVHKNEPKRKITTLKPMNAHTHHFTSVNTNNESYLTLTYI